MSQTNQDAAPSAATATGGIGFSLATPADDAGIRQLLRETPMGGRIQLSFRRDPSYLDAARILGSEVQVIVARDGERVVGVACRALRSSWINGSPTTAGYLADLRIHPRYRGGTLLHRGYRMLRALHGDNRAAVYSTVIVEDNALALATLTGQRAGLPSYHDLGRLLTPLIPLTRRRSSPKGRVTRGGPELMPRILDRLNDNRMQFAPIYGAADFAPGGRLLGLRPEDFLVLWRGDHLAGVLAVWDQRSARQTVVAGYGAGLRQLRPLLNIWRRPRLPSSGSTLAFAYVALVSTEDVDAFRILLGHAVHESQAAGFDHLVVGLHERDPRVACLRAYPQTRFAGRLFAVTFDTPLELDHTIPYVEAALL